MTLLGREMVAAVSIAAVTAVLVAGRSEERRGVVHVSRPPRSRLATISALGVVAIVAAIGVVAVFGPHRLRP